MEGQSSSLSYRAFKESSVHEAVIYTLQTLPMEIQLRILEYCLISETAIVNCGSRYKHSKQHKHQRMVPCWIPFLDVQGLNILFTSHQYHEEGWKIFWQMNRFEYSDTFFMRSAMDNYRPLYMTNIRHMALHDLRCGVDGAGFPILLSILRLLDPLKDLETLDIAFEQRRDFQWFGEDKEDSTEQLSAACSIYGNRPQSTLYQTGIAQVKWTNPYNIPYPLEGKGNMKQITISGLPGDHSKIEPLIVRLLSPMISDQGRIGINITERTTSRFVSPWNPNVFAIITCLQEKSEMEWITLDNMEEWIYKHGHLHEPSELQDWMVRLFEEVDRNDPFFKGWA